MHLLEEIEFEIAKVKEEVLAGRKYLTKWRNGLVHVKKSAGLRSITGLSIFLLLKIISFI